MTNVDAMGKVERIFKQIENARSVEALQTIINDHSYTSMVERFESKYKPFNLSITAEEVRQLLGSNEDHERFEITSEMISAEDTLTKLMFAVLWKNGHVDRVNHLINGVLDRSTPNESEAVVFRQFGKSLRDADEPIVDQHVLRAFEIHTLEPDLDSAIAKARKRNIYNDTELVSNYRSWFQKKLGQVEINEKREFKYLLDKILFCLGKEIKQHKKVGKTS